MTRLTRDVLHIMCALTTGTKIGRRAVVWDYTQGSHIIAPDDGPKVMSIEFRRVQGRAQRTDLGMWGFHWLSCGPVPGSFWPSIFHGAQLNALIRRGLVERAEVQKKPSEKPRAVIRLTADGHRVGKRIMTLRRLNPEPQNTP